MNNPPKPVQQILPSPDLLAIRMDKCHREQRDKPVELVNSRRLSTARLHEYHAEHNLQTDHHLGHGCGRPQEPMPQSRSPVGRQRPETDGTVGRNHRPPEHGMEGGQRHRPQATGGHPVGAKREALQYSGGVRHRRYYIQTLSASGRAVPSTGGDLVVASKEQTGDLDWELIHRSSERYLIRQEPHDLEMSGPEGTFCGPAILVRSDGRSHVFRGVGRLEGFDPSQLSDGDGQGHESASG